jgi:hypothetical protein
LCDLALLLEQTGSGFDWRLCLGADPRRANWILSAAGLANKLLDASICNEAIAARAAEVPDWLVENVLQQWETPFATAQPPMNYRAPIKSYLTSPIGLVADLRRRWPNPILATVSVNGIFSARRRRRYQLGNCSQRLARLLLYGSGEGRPVSQ